MIQLGMGTTLSVRLRFCELERTGLTELALKTDLKSTFRASLASGFVNSGQHHKCWPGLSKCITWRYSNFQKRGMAKAVFDHVTSQKSFFPNKTFRCIFK